MTSALVWQIGLPFGVVLSVVLGVRGKRNDREMDLEAVVGLILCSVAAAAALRVGWIAVTSSEDELRPFSGEDRVYLFIGGVALLWASAAEMFRRWRHMDPVS